MSTTKGDITICGARRKHIQNLTWTKLIQLYVGGMQRRDEGGSFGVKTSKVNRTGSGIMEADYVGMIKKEKRDKEGSLRERI